LQERGILYAPDFLINAGGIINVYAELAHYDREDYEENRKYLQYNFRDFRLCCAKG
jgi:glutamate dehydrogenase/leucine dehydrogenase